MAGHTSGWVIALVLIIIFGLIGGAAFFWYTRIYKPQHSGSAGDSAFPSPAPSGIAGWISSKIEALKNRRSRTGAGYEEAGYSGARGAPRRGPLDPDEAWDSRVGNEADVYGPGGYYEEQELGLQQPTAYSGAGYAAAPPSAGFTPAPGLAPSNDRGRSKSPSRNPFGDDAAESLRDVSPRPVSPRPIDTGLTRAAKKKDGETDSSSPRRSMFRENM
jgi:hypothetical protein